MISGNAMTGCRCGIVLAALNSASPMLRDIARLPLIRSFSTKYPVPARGGEGRDEAAAAVE